MGLERYLNSSPTPEPVVQPEPVPDDTTPRGLERYANIQGDQPDLPDGRMQEFQRALNVSTDNLQKTVWGFANMTAETLGLEHMQAFTMRQIHANEEQMKKLPLNTVAWDDIQNTDEALTWMASAVGQAIPSLGLSFASGGVGGVLGRKALEHKLRDRLLKKVEERMLARGFTAAEATAAAQKTVMSARGATILRRTAQGSASSQFQNPGFARGATIGTFGSSTIPQVGEAHLRLKEAGIFAPGTALAAGLAGGTLELLPVLRLIDRAFPGVDREFSKNFIRDFAKSAGIQGLMEGSTEGAQEVIQLAALAYHDPNFDLLDPENRSQVIEAFAQGALVGVLTGGLGEVGGALTQGSRKAKAKVDLPEWRLGLRDRLRGTKEDEAQPELADNTFMEELNERLTKLAEETIEPAMNAVRNTFQTGIDEVNNIAPEMNDEMFRWVDRILAAHQSFVDTHSPVSDDVARYIGEQVEYIANEAETITDPNERSDFIEKSIAEIEQHLKETAGKLARRGQEEAKRVQSTLDGEGVSFDDFSQLRAEIEKTDQAKQEAADLEEAQEYYDSIVPQTPGREVMATDEEFLFGQVRRREVYRDKKGNKKTTEVITRGQEAVPLKTRKSARGLVERLRKKYPSATDSTFEIIETKDGKFLVQMVDPMQRESLIEDEQLWQIQENARISTIRRGQKQADREARQAKVKGGRVLDVPTLAFEGRRVGAGDNQTLRDSFLTVAGMMFDRGIITGADFQRLNDKFEAYFDSEEKNMSLQRARELDDKNDIDPGSRFSNVRKVLQEMRESGRKTSFSPREDIQEEHKLEGESSATDDQALLDRQAAELRQRGRISKPKTPADIQITITQIESGIERAKAEIERLKKVEPTKKPTAEEKQAPKKGMSKGQLAAARKAAKERLANLKEQLKTQKAELQQAITDQKVAKVESEIKDLSESRKKAIALQKKLLQEKKKVKTKGGEVETARDNYEAAKKKFGPDANASNFMQYALNAKAKIAEAKRRLDEAIAKDAKDTKATKAALDNEIKRVRENRQAIDKALAEKRAQLAELRAPKKKPKKISISKEEEQARAERIEQLEALEQQQLDPELDKKIAALEKKLAGTESQASINNKREELARLRKAKNFGREERLELARLRRTLNEKTAGKAKELGEVGEARAKKRVAELEQMERDSKTEGIDARIKQLESDIKAFNANAKTRNQLTELRRSKSFGPKQAEELRRLRAGQEVEGIAALPTQKPQKVAVHLPGVAPRVRQAVVELVNRAAKLLSNKVKIRVINATGAQQMIDTGHPHAFEAKQLLESEYDFAILRRADGVMYILVDDFTNVGRSTIGMLHELGHAIHYDTWESLNKTMQGKLWKAFVADVDAGRTSGRYVNMSEETRGKMPKAKKDIKEFNEWMADQFVAWMNNRRAPRSALEKFMESVAQKMDQLWNYIKNNAGRYGQLNETYGQFADAVAQNLRRKDPTGRNQFFLNEAANGAPLTALLAGEGRQIVPAGLTEQAWGEIVQRLENQFPATVKSAKKMVQTMDEYYQLLLAPSTSVLKSMRDRGITAVEPLITIFGRDIGKAKTQRNYHQNVKRMKGIFSNQFDAITKGMSQGQKLILLKRMRALDRGETVNLDDTGDNPALDAILRRDRAKVAQLRKLLDDMHAYLVASGLPVGRIENYFPRIFDREKLIADKNKILRHLKTKRKMSDKKARAFYGSLISSEAESAAALAELQVDELSMQAPAFRNMRGRVTTDPFWNDYLQENLDNVMANYINAAVKRGEYNRAVGTKAPKGATGGDTLSLKMWNPHGRIDDILKAAEAQGATQEDLLNIKRYVDANLGMYGRDAVSDSARRVMASVVAYQNMRTLMFTVFASLPDLVGPMIRAGNLKNSTASLVKHFSELGDEGKIGQMARAWGIVSSVASHSIMTEYVDNHYMPPFLRKANDAFFTVTGLNFYTDTTRKMALAVGVDYIKQMASESVDKTKTLKERNAAKRALRELGLTVKNVNDWMIGGEEVWGGIGYTGKSKEQRAADEKVSQALVQFVDEAILSPNASQRPLLASHPGFMLVYHLKGYMFAIHETILKRISHNVSEGIRKSDSNADMAMHIGVAIAPAVMMMALTALGIELRELVMGRDRTERMDGWEYTWTLFERAGLTGIAQLGFDFEGAGARGQNEFAAILGPTVSQLSDLISRPATQTIPKAIPGVSQLPWARNALRDVVGQSPADRAERRRKRKEKEAIARKAEEESQKKAPPSTIYYERGADVDTQARQVAAQLVELKRENPDYRVNFNVNRLNLNDKLLARTAAYYVAFMKQEGLKL